MESLEKISDKLTVLIGTPASILIHTILFIGIFSLKLFGASTDEILLLLTTAVSLEAIYLAIFIQMSINSTAHHIADVKEDIGEIQEDVQGLEEDVDSLESSSKEDDSEEDEVTKVLSDIEKRLGQLQKDIALLKKKGIF